MFEYIKGQRLNNFLYTLNKKNEITSLNPVKLSYKCQIIIEIIKIVQYLHIRKIICKSLTTKSFILNKNNNNKIYLVDFLNAEENPRFFEDSNNSYDDTNETLNGNKLRINAELLRCNKIDNIADNDSRKEYIFTYKVDIWSIGAIMLEMFTGKSIFKDKAYVGVYNAIVYNLDISFPKVMSEVYPEIERMVKGCTDQDCERRWELDMLMKEMNELKGVYEKREEEEMK